MKTISGALNSHFGQDCMTLAVLWKAIRRDGRVFGFTTHDEDIVYNDGLGGGPVVYFASTGFTNSAAETKADMSPDNLEVTGFLDSTAITDADIRAGLWNEAVIQIFIVNWADLTMGDLKVRQGTTGVLKMVNGVFTAELRGITQKLSTVIGMQYGPLCRAELFSVAGGGDDSDSDNHYLCNLNVADWNQNGSVSASSDATHIVPNAGLVMRGSATPTSPAPAGWFKDGLLLFTGGPMNGFFVEIKDWDGTTLTTFLPMPYQPLPGDTFIIEPGCNKTIQDCFTKFSNIVNHRGEAFIPGNDLILLYPNQK